MILNNENRAYTILTSAQGVGSVKRSKILSLTNDPSRLYTDVEGMKKEIVEAVGEKCFEELKSAKKAVDFEKEEELLDRYGITPVGISDGGYPKALKLIEDPPLILYCRGDVSLLNTRSIGVVGTRYPTRYGLRVTEEFVERLSGSFTIVSGMARGIDAAAHRTALSSKGKTVAVLGSGVEQIYPSENAKLYAELIEKGLVISEYPVGTPVAQHHFPARNRIISGLSLGVLVTEAGEKSGTMLTINHALSQGKEIFCVPGSIYNTASAGCNKLIRECQGAAVTSPEDVLSCLGIKKKENKKNSVVQLDINEEILYSAIESKGEAHFDELMAEVNLPVAQLNVLLVKLQARGLIYKNKNNYWSIE